MVRPPPGVASAVSRPPMASVNPFATARPEPDAGALGVVVEALERAEHVQDPFRRDTPAVVDDAQLARGTPAERGRAEPAGGSHHHDVRIRGVLDGVLDDVCDHALQHALVGIDLGHVGWKLHPHPSRRDAMQCAGDHLVPAEGAQLGADRVGGDAGHVQQVADQKVEPVGAFLDRGQQLLLFLRGVPDVGPPEAADGELDPGQRCPQIVGDRAEDGRAHGVALGQAHHFAPAGHELLALQLGGQVHAEGCEEPPVAGRQDPAVEDQPGGGVDLLDVLAVGACRRLERRRRTPGAARFRRRRDPPRGLG